jgi:hypothetical protein
VEKIGHIMLWCIGVGITVNEVLIYLTRLFLKSSS